MSDDIQEPVAAFAVSPDDRSADRTQSDANQIENVARNDADRVQSDENQRTWAAANADDRIQSDADQAVTVERIDALIESSNEVAKAALVGSERERVSRRRFGITLMALSIIAVGLLVTAVVVFVKLNDSLVSAAQSRDQIKDCIQPTGKCYKDGQKNTGKVIGTVQQVIVLAAACAPSYVGLPIDERTAAIEQCIEAGLK